MHVSAGPLLGYMDVGVSQCQVTMCLLVLCKLDLSERKYLIRDYVEIYLVGLFDSLCLYTGR